MCSQGVKIGSQSDFVEGEMHGVLVAFEFHGRRKNCLKILLGRRGQEGTEGLGARIWHILLLTGWICPSASVSQLGVESQLCGPPGPQRAMCTQRPGEDGLLVWPFSSHSPQLPAH